MKSTTSFFGCLFLSLFFSCQKKPESAPLHSRDEIIIEFASFLENPPPQDLHNGSKKLKNQHLNAPDLSH